MNTITVPASQYVMPVEATSAIQGAPLEKSTWKAHESSLNSAVKNNVSMKDLLALILQIVESSALVRQEVIKNQIKAAVSTSILAGQLAADKRTDAQLRFGISVASSTIQMAVTTCSTVRMGQSKTVSDKHLSNTSAKEMADSGGVKLLKTTDLDTGKVTNYDKSRKVSDLSPDEINKFNASLQQQRTAKYNSVSQMAGMADGIMGNINEIQHAESVNEQEQFQASIDMKKTFDAQHDDFLKHLATEASKLQEIIDSIGKASLVTNR